MRQFYSYLSWILQSEQSEKTDCYLTVANTAYMNIGLINFLLSLCSCFPTLEKSSPDSRTTAGMFIRNAAMCLFVEEKGAGEATKATNRIQQM